MGCRPVLSHDPWRPIIWESSVRMTLATTRKRHPLRSKIKAAIRDSAPLWAIQRISNPLIRRWPVESIPGWVGKVHGLRVPRGVVPYKTPSPEGHANINIILSLTKAVLDFEGDFAECGVYRGSTIIPLGLYLAQNNSRKKVFGFDSFAGFGDCEHIDPTEDVYIRTYGSCTDTSYEMVQAKIAHLNLSEQVILIKGFFNASLSAVKDRKFCFVHLDCDLYESYKVCLNFFYDRMVSGGVILLDEYNDLPCPGCNRAVDEFLVDKPERPIEICSDNYMRYFIHKS
jgi:O-methyltransferase